MKAFYHLIFFTIAAVLYFAEGKYINIGEYSQQEGEPTNNFENICSIEKVPLITCFCDSIERAGASRVRCWIVGEIEEDNIVWQYFQTQPDVENMLLIVALNMPGLTYLPTEMIRNATKLKNFEISLGNIKQLNSLSFKNSASLEQIALPTNKISTLEHHTFSNLTSLVNLSLNDNKLTEIKSSAFHDLPNLKRLDLSNNQIMALLAGTFKHLTTLLDLNLNGNSLCRLPKGSFEGLSNILRLEIKRNKLTYIGDFTFVDMTSLEELYLDENQINHISKRALSGLTNLKKLSLTANELSLICDTTFVDLININYLDLSNNEFTELKEDLFKPMFENMRSSDFVLKLNDNTLACDCSLSWLESVRNRTNSLELQVSLDTLLCSSEYPLPYLLPNHSIAEVEHTTKTVKQNLYGFEEPEAYQPSPEKARNTMIYSQKILTELLSVPRKFLPCKKTAKTSKYAMKKTLFHSKVLPVKLLSANEILEI